MCISGFVASSQDDALGWAIGYRVEYSSCYTQGFSLWEKSVKMVRGPCPTLKQDTNSGSGEHKGSTTRSSL